MDHPRRDFAVAQFNGPNVVQVFKTIILFKAFSGLFVHAVVDEFQVNP